MIRNHVKLATVGTLVLALLSTPGCGGASATSGQQGSDLQGLLTLYNSATRKLGHRPQSEEELRQYAADLDAQALERLKVQSVDELFISSRDGKPYVVLYGPETSGGVVAYEAEGVNGIRQVGDQMGRIRNMNAEQFAELGL